MMRRLLALTALTIGLMAVGTPAIAVSWGPNSSYYNGTKRVTGSGTFTNSGNTRANSTMKITDNSADGNNVYGRTTFSFYGYRCDPDCSSRWRTDVSKSTPEWSGGTHSYTVSDDLVSWGDKARGTVVACAQMGWPVPDSCAPAAYPSFSY